MLLESIARKMQDLCGVDQSKLLVIGVSGGPDSLSLLDILHRIGYRLCVIHVNHQLRPEAEQEGQLVRQAAEARGLMFVTQRVEVLPHADESKLPVEAAARELRYRFLFEQAQLLSAQAVAVGHTADDQVETVLMHLLWGSGLTGLRGMSYRSLPNAWSAAIPLVRPMLGIWRSEIDAYCAAQGLRPILDQTNQDTTYTRNRLRHELLPVLETYQPHFRQHLMRMAGLLAGEDDLLDQLVETAWVECLARQGEGFVAIDLGAFTKQPLAIQRRLVRRAVGELRQGLTDLTFEDVERALVFAQQPPLTKQSDWMGGLRLVVEDNLLWLVRWDVALPQAGWPQLAGDESLSLGLPGVIALGQGWTLRAEQVALDGELLLRVLTNSDPYQAWLDAERLEWPLVVRRRKHEDVFQPLGLHGKQVELRLWMIKQKLTQRARAAWPVVCSGEVIVWIPGFQPSHLTRITAETKQVIHLSLVKEIA